MTPECIDEAARELANARKENWRINLSDGVKPRSEEAAVAICQALWRLEGGEAAGWKIGAADPKAREKSGLKQPFVGRIAEADVVQSPATFHHPELQRPAVEAEYAFRMAKDLPPRGERYTREEVEAAIEALHIGVEVPESRLVENHDLGPLAAVCDHGGVGRYVMGAGFTDWKSHDLVGQQVTMTIDGKEVGLGTGALMMGHPVEALTWLVNYLSAIGITLKAGQFVSTGSCTGIALATPGAKTVADFGLLGKVEVAFPE